jgi:hypothetical protein
MLYGMRCPLLLGAVALTSCNYRGGPLPDRAEIIRVEKALSKAPCIGKITDWVRTYQYHVEAISGAAFLSRLNRQVIDFDLGRGTKPGGFTVRRRPPFPPMKWILDERSLARGSYNLRSGNLDFQFCQKTPARR